MIIEVKGTQTKSTEPDPAQRYVLKNADERSNTPLYLGLFLSGVALYLKSMFSGSASAGERAPGAVEEDAGREPTRPPELKVLPADESQEAPPQPAAASAPPSSKKKVMSSSAPLEPTAAFHLIDAPPLKFKRLDLPSLDAFKTSPVIPLPTNDNGAPAQGGAGASGGGSGAESEAAGGRRRPADSVDDDDENAAEEDEGDDTPAPNANRAPRVGGPVYLADVAGCATLVIALSDLLRTAEDPDSDALSVQNVSASAGVLSASGGGWVFRGDHEGPVVITYEVTDGKLSVQQTAHFAVLKQAPVIGSEGDDLLLGSLCADEIEGRGGNDNIDARDGHDLVTAGAGDDHVLAGQGDDTVFGGEGDDIVFAGSGDDYISGGAGHDRLFGEAGNDVIFGDAGNDVVSGGEGADRLFGGADDDVLHGDAGNDHLDGGDGSDRLFGGADHDLIAGADGDDLIEGEDGDDVLRDGEGVDVVRGGAGDDVALVALDGDEDAFDGGSGFDTLDYSSAQEGLTVDLVQETAVGAEIGHDTIGGFEQVVGGEGDDRFVVGDTPVVLAGSGGENEFVFADPAPSQPVLVMHEILDFKPGDLIRMSKYDIFEEVLDEFDDEFEAIYDDQIDEDDVTIRHRTERVDEMDRTIIEADFDNDDVFETTIVLHGNHALVMVEQTPTGV